MTQRDEDDCDHGAAGATGQALADWLPATGQRPVSAAIQPKCNIAARSLRPDCAQSKRLIQGGISVGCRPRSLWRNRKRRWRCCQSSAENPSYRPVKQLPRPTRVSVQCGQLRQHTFTPRHCSSPSLTVRSPSLADAARGPDYSTPPPPARVEQVKPRPWRTALCWREAGASSA